MNSNPSASDGDQRGSPLAGSLDQLLALLSQLDPIELAGRAVDTGRRTTESLLSILENLAATIDNLNSTTRRVNALLDDVEEPLRRLLPQVGAAMGALATLGESASQIVELGRRLSPLATLAENAGGVFSTLSSRSGSPQAPPPPPPGATSA